VSQEANYTYDELLQRVQILLTGGDAGSSLPGRVPIKMPPISLVRIGTKKTRWDNFQVRSPTTCFDQSGLAVA
jgi:hypothetical protein